MWNLPGLGLEPVSPALAGGFLTTAPPGKPCGLVIDRGDGETNNNSNKSGSSWPVLGGACVDREAWPAWESPTRGRWD